eukprot:scaffold306_cov525-Prasinococcus_capsulatus_cf.AAC.28
MSCLRPPLGRLLAWLVLVWLLPVTRSASHGRRAVKKRKLVGPRAPCQPTGVDHSGACRPQELWKRRHSSRADAAGRALAIYLANQTRPDWTVHTQDTAVGMARQHVAHHLRVGPPRRWI